MLTPEQWAILEDPLFILFVLVVSIVVAVLAWRAIRK